MPVAPKPDLSPFGSKYKPLDALYCTALLFRDLRANNLGRAFQRGIPELPEQVTSHGFAVARLRVRKSPGDRAPFTAANRTRNSAGQMLRFNGGNRYGVPDLESAGPSGEDRSPAATIRPD